MSQNLRTKAAAAYLTGRGLQTSQSYLEKCRPRGIDDPRDPGPDFYRDDAGVCWYDIAALDRYLAIRVAGRKFRASAPQPENFRRPE
jgi:hypothetical protein